MPEPIRSLAVIELLLRVHYKSCGSMATLGGRGHAAVECICMLKEIKSF